MKQIFRRESILGILTWLFFASSAVPSWAQELINVSDANRIALGIQTERLRSASSVESIKATGRVISPIGQSRSISSPFEGVLIESLVVAGMEVKRGQNIAHIYSADYAAGLVEREQARLMAEHNAELAERAVELGDIGLRSIAEVDEAKHEARSSLISLSAIEKRLGRVQPAAGAGQFYIRASEKGIVTHVHATAGASLAKSSPVVSMFSGDAYWASIPVPEADIDLIHIGSLIAFQNTDLNGTVIAIDPEVDGVSRTVDVTILLPDETSWRLGGLVTATFLTPPPTRSVAVPSRAIVRVSGQTYVFQEFEGGFKTVPVNILSQSYHTSFISGNLSEGDIIAVSGLAALKNVVEAG